MKRSVLLASLLVAAAFANNMWAAAPQGSSADQQKATLASEFDRQLANLEKQVVGAAGAMPEDKFNFAPTGPGDFKGVRTFALEVKHIAVANYMLGAAILQEKPPMDMKGPNGPENISSRADIMKFLKDSFAYAHRALAAMNESNMVEPIKSPFGNNQTTRLSLAIRIVAHPFDHYGQMVEYLRMNSIIPPASRGQ
jgi:hypothetical protein